MLNLRGLRSLGSLTTSTQVGTTLPGSDLHFASTIVGNMGCPLGTVAGVNLDHDSDSEEVDSDSGIALQGFDTGSTHRSH